MGCVSPPREAREKFVAVEANAERTCDAAGAKVLVPAWSGHSPPQGGGQRPRSDPPPRRRRSPAPLRGVRVGRCPPPLGRRSASAAGRRRRRPPRRSGAVSAEAEGVVVVVAAAAGVVVGRWQGSSTELFVSCSPGTTPALVVTSPTDF